MQLHTIYEKKYNKIKIIPFGDLHYGATECNMHRAKETINWIKDEPNTRVILMGDLLNSATKTSVGAGPFEENVSGQKQYDDIVKFLYPIKNKIYGSLIGNHEYRIFKETGYNVTKILAKELNHKYYGFGCFLRLRILDQNYIIYATHGSSGATLPYTKIKRALDLGSFIDADIYLYAHVHSLQIHTQQYKKINLKKGIVTNFKKYFILTGHYLNYEDSYAEMKNIKPEKQGSPTITLTGGKLGRHIRIII